MADQPGEFEQIHRYFSPLASNEPGALGLGDDAALIPAEPGTSLVITSDMMIEGTHFREEDPPKLIAQKLLRVNLSDLASMGALPKHYTLGLSLPLDTTEEWVSEFAAGLELDQKTFGITLIGGDTVATSGPATMSITALGTSPEGAALKRSGASDGDEIWVSGTIGDGALGLAALRGELADLSSELLSIGQQRYQLPEPRITLGLALHGIASSAIDISDGLLADLGHICEQSGVAASLNIDEVPLSQLGHSAVTNNKATAIELAAGGDDFELLFTASAHMSEDIQAISTKLDVPITCIGSVSSGSGMKIYTRDGVQVRPVSTGYQHF